MPRYEKQGRDKEYFCEVVLDDVRVYVAQGERKTGTSEWTITDTDRRTYGFRFEPERAPAFYAEQIAELAHKKYTNVGDATPEVAAMQAKREQAG